jgi:hypothetical protein
MVMNRFLIIANVCLILAGIGFAYGAGSYVVSATDGLNDVAGVVLNDNGSAFTLGRPFFFASSARIGTTSPQIVTVNGVQKVWIHHTFLGPNNLPVYGIAKYDLATGQLEALLPVPRFLISRLDVLNIFTSPNRTLNSKRNTNDIFSALLNPASGAPGARKSVFNNVTASDVVFGATISRDGKFSVESVQHLQSRMIQSRKVLSGGGAGLANVLSTDVVGYSPTITDTLGTAAPAAALHASATFRLLAYRVFRNFGTANQQSQILTQQLDDTTGQAIGTPKPLTNFVKAPQFGPQSTHSVALAQDGSFILYTVNSSACKKEIMVIQRLGASGNKVGPPKTLFGCTQLSTIPIGLFGMDVVKLP